MKATGISCATINMKMIVSVTATKKPFSEMWRSGSCTFPKNTTIVKNNIYRALKEMRRIMKLLPDLME
jgi:hypothetical protein